MDTKSKMVAKPKFLAECKMPTESKMAAKSKSIAESKRAAQSNVCHTQSSPWIENAWQIQNDRQAQKGCIIRNGRKNPKIIQAMQY